MKTTEIRRILLAVTLAVVLLLLIYFGSQAVLNWQTKATTTTGQQTTSPTTAESTSATTSETSGDAPTSSPATSPGSAVTSKPSETVVTSPTFSYITPDQAAAIAMARIGAQARLISIDQDTDDNPPVYEIRAADQNYSYEIEVHAITGAILDFEKEEIEEDDESETDESNQAG